MDSSHPSERFREGSFPGNLLRFGEVLRQAGLPVTPARLIDATRAVDLIDLADPGDVYWTLRVLLVDQPADLPVYDALFHHFWLAGPDPPRPVATERTAEETAGIAAGGSVQIVQTGAGEDIEATESLTIPIYSPSEDLGARDFGTLDPAQAERLAYLVAQLAKRLVTRPSRRRQAAPRGRELDLRRTIRRNFKYGGLPVELSRRRRRRRRGPIVVICDVSRSMSVYSRFLLLFVHGLQNAAGGRVESFVFSTRLYRVTENLRGQPVDQVFRQLQVFSRDWAGGMRIGRSLAEFVRRHGPRVLTRRTTVIILSDGLDTGDLEELDRAMAEIRWRAGKVIWLNPLAGDVRYEPLAGGMRTALPYLDVFAAAHNLTSLAALRDQLG
ncbi:MAG TPA: VWA domain-containing protein [Dehalococcoidia bacterium]|nr:VWA domain-containing protein [Dehalococcoidia bacterium]